MRYAVMEFFFEDNKPVFKWVGTNMSRTSANDAIKAWNYQASRKGGWMEIIEDSQEAFDAKKAEIMEFNPRINPIKKEN